jgi:hypothetical protein
MRGMVHVVLTQVFGIALAISVVLFAITVEDPHRC